MLDKAMLGLTFTHPQKPAKAVESNDPQLRQGQEQGRRPDDQPSGVASIDAPISAAGMDRLSVARAAPQSDGVFASATPPLPIHPFEELGRAGSSDVVRSTASADLAAHDAFSGPVRPSELRAGASHAIARPSSSERVAPTGSSAGAARQVSSVMLELGPSVGTHGTVPGLIVAEVGEMTSRAETDASVAILGSHPSSGERDGGEAAQVRSRRASKIQVGAVSAAVRSDPQPSDARRGAVDAGIAVAAPSRPVSAAAAGQHHVVALVTGIEETLPGGAIENVGTLGPPRRSWTRVLMPLDNESSGAPPPPLPHLGSTQVLAISDPDSLESSSVRMQLLRVRTAQDLAIEAVRGQVAERLANIPEAASVDDEDADATAIDAPASAGAASTAPRDRAPCGGVFRSLARLVRDGALWNALSISAMVLIWTGVSCVAGSVLVAVSASGAVIGTRIGGTSALLFCVGAIMIASSFVAQRYSRRRRLAIAIVALGTAVGAEAAGAAVLATFRLPLATLAFIGIGTAQLAPFVLAMVAWLIVELVVKVCAFEGSCRMHGTVGSASFPCVPQRRIARGLAELHTDGALLTVMHPPNESSTLLYAFKPLGAVSYEWAARNGYTRGHSCRLQGLLRENTQRESARWAPGGHGSLLFKRNYQVCSCARCTQLLAWRASLGPRRALVGVIYAALVLAISAQLFLCLVFGVKFANEQVSALRSLRLNAARRYAVAPGLFPSFPGRCLGDRESHYVCN